MIPTVLRMASNSNLSIWPSNSRAATAIKQNDAMEPSIQKIARMVVPITCSMNVD